MGWRFRQSILRTPWPVLMALLLTLSVGIGVGVVGLAGAAGLREAAAVADASGSALWDFLKLFVPLVFSLVVFASTRAVIEYKEKISKQHALVVTMVPYAERFVRRIPAFRGILAGVKNEKLFASGRLVVPSLSIPEDVVKFASRLAELDPLNAEAYEEFLVETERISKTIELLGKLQVSRVQFSPSGAEMTEAIFVRLESFLKQTTELVRVEANLVEVSGYWEEAWELQKLYADAQQALETLGRLLAPSWSSQLSQKPAGLF